MSPLSTGKSIRLLMAHFRLIQSSQLCADFINILKIWLNSFTCMTYTWYSMVSSENIFNLWISLRRTHKVKINYGFICQYVVLVCMCMREYQAGTIPDDLFSEICV
jgi:hypothetical protein